MNLPNKELLDQIDTIITYILNTVRKKVEGPRRNIPFSQIKEKFRLTMLFWKNKLK